MYSSLNSWLQGQGLPPTLIQSIEGIFSVAILALIALIAIVITNFFWERVLARLITHSPTKWDDAFAQTHFFRRLLLLPALLLCYISAGILFLNNPLSLLWTRRFLLALLVMLLIRTFDAAIQAVNKIYDGSQFAKTRPIRSYLSVLRILCYIMGGIFIISIIANKSPWGIISVFGGLTAVLLLIFKDSILGFVANLQLTSNDMVREGDWIEVPKFNADGDVIDISLHTVKIQNWDKTISTIPSYALITDGFKNWRGMAESGGRRIKRAIYLDMNSIHFCSKELLTHLEQIKLLSQYMIKKTGEINDFNMQQQDAPLPGNLRQQTNIGIFRAYVENYLQANDQINKELTFLVRQLSPTAQGLPLEIYVFSKDKVWANYEAIQADIFDHLLAIIPEFELRVFQYPSGSDLHPSLLS